MSTRVNWQHEPLTTESQLATIVPAGNAQGVGSLLGLPQAPADRWEQPTTGWVPCPPGCLKCPKPMPNFSQIFFSFIN